IDLVITDLHMPEMNGLELQKEINEEFIHLPVMVMSSDDRESVIMKSLASGAVFYMVKPVNPDALRNVWQYAVTSKKGKSIFTEEKSSLANGSSAEKISFLHDIVSGSSMIEEKESKTNSKRKASKRRKDELEGENAAAPKKAKVVWTNSLHNRFLQAIRHITLEKAVPKKILEFMNVPGLTRENVASHLQKYRIFLKRVADDGINAALKNFNHRSSLASGRTSMMLQEVQDYAQAIEKQLQMRTSPFIPRYGRGISELNGNTSFGSIGLQSHNSLSHVGLLGVQDNFHQPFFGNTTYPLYQANPGTTFGTGLIDMGTNSFSCGGLSGGLMNGTNSNQIFHQKSKLRPDPYDNNTGASSLKGFGASGLEKMWTINNNPYLNYAGIRLKNDGDQLVGAGEVGLNVKGDAGAGNEGATFHHLPLGYSSSPAGFAVGNEQEHTSVLPPLSLSQQQYCLGKKVENDFTFGLMNDANASVNDDTAQPGRLGEGADFGDLLFDLSDFQFLFQPQGDGEGALNPNIGSGSGSHQPELNRPINQSQNPVLPSAFADNASGPWNEPTLEQACPILN
ncbi:hypothetical protein CISIN_1g040406mg, partial [Citrus sinensis]